MVEGRAIDMNSAPRNARQQNKVDCEFPLDSNSCPS